MHERSFFASRSASACPESTKGDLSHPGAHRFLSHLFHLGLHVQMSVLVDIALCGWFRQYVGQVSESKRRRTIPSMGWNGHCHSCSLPRLISGEASSRCSLCLRFRVSASLLTSSSFCSCPCECYQNINDTEEAGADDVLDSDYTGQCEETFRVPIDHDSNTRSTVSSRRTSTSSISSTFSQRYNVDEDEFFRLCHGLDFWELHDLEVISGLSQDQLMDRFPEVESVHGRRRQEEEPPSPVPTFCQDCQRPLFREVVQSIDRGLVNSCKDCSRPLLANERGADGLLAPEDFAYCRCRCVCDEYDEENVETCYLPFVCRCRHLAPAPWVRAILEEKGFCIPDRCSDGGFCAMVRESNLPTLSQIRNHTYLEDCRQHMHEAGLEHQHYLDIPTFPNGVPKDRSTDSGLPLVLENYFRSLDPGAFGHEPSTRSHAPGADGGNCWEVAETPNGLPNLGPLSSLYDVDRNSRLVTLHCWINQNEWRLEEDDAESTCTADDLGICRDQYTSDLYIAEDFGRVPNAVASHDYRHLYRRYERITQLGGYTINPDDLEHVVQSELEYHDYLEFLDHDRASVLRTEDMPATNPFPRPEEGREEDILEEAQRAEAALSHTGTQTHDILDDSQTLRTSDDAAFHMLQHLQRTRLVVVGGPIYPANAPPDMPGPFR